ncbi:MULTISPECIES: helix-turn-helix domain-containing protein [unclassified Frankia]|uniref:helix-turn-helix domain-containing protein n=1 Tax=unclassified Frankia TaxID=2632575 RepID=UPI002024CAEB
MVVADLVRGVRADAGLSVRALADAAGVAASTVHRIERGELQPTVDTLRRIIEAAGMRLHIDVHPDYSASMVGLARSIVSDIPAGERTEPVRKAAELAHRFRGADPDIRRRMITAMPPATGDQRWDAFLAALAEWLAVQEDLPVPAWAHHDSRYLRHGWWVTSMPSMRAWEYAGSPVSFQNHGVYLHRDSLTNI